KALAAFAGVQRRFQVRGTVDRVTVVDDYGHHPVEIRATLAAAKAGFDCRIVTVFQPHRYTRTKHLFEEFLTAFNEADVLIVMDIYPAGEAPIAGVTAADLAEGIRAHGHRNVTYLGSDRQRIVDHVCEITRPGDIVLTLGAGDVSQLGPEILQRLEADSQERRASMLGEIRGEVRFKERLSFHTSLRIGRPADIFAVPQDVTDIRPASMSAGRRPLAAALD